MPCSPTTPVVKTTSRSVAYSWQKRYKTGTWSFHLSGSKSYTSDRHVDGQCTSGGYSQPAAPTFRDPTYYSGDHIDRYPTVVHTDMLLGRLDQWQYRNLGVLRPNASIGLLPAVYDVDQYKPEAEMKAMSKFSDIDFNFPVAFAERAKTLALAEDFLDGVIDLVRSIRRRKGGDFANAVSNLWLMYRYGLMPTWYDLYGLAETIEKNDNGTYDKHRYTSRADVFDVINESGTADLSYSLGMGYTVITKYQRERRHGCRVRIDAIPNPVTHQYRRLNDLGLLNPALLAWELTPLSFVVDWFVGFGDFLEAYSAPIGLICLGTSSTCYHSANVTITSQTAHPTAGTRIIGGKMEPGEPGRQLFFARFVSPSFPAPQLVINRHPLNLKRLLDSVALLQQMLR